MFELYRKSQQVQYNWIRNHPVQWITVNAIITGAVVGYMVYKDRKDQQKFQEEITTQDQ